MDRLNQKTIAINRRHSQDDKRARATAAEAVSHGMFARSSELGRLWV
jgi:hypothetical protein